MNNETIISDSNWEEMMEAVCKELQISDEQVEKAAMDKIANASQDGMTFGEYLSIAKQFADSWS